ncbi:acyl-CoA thioesterase [Spiractinospora alimapuensis]|uniref:acyl-CoA thioesterase n=1 Tax=Spiractinospora alimapuensis TaxID=2820884 RepID=UPI001F3D8C45|nr:thioesterase family protein [Spiractinospora alimapuensis]QVQ50046.1 acyl-CoA thioesterase [Spiractinospora alimapuensis]
MSGASVTVRRRLEWIDTDAAGIWHYSTVFRFVEHAEHELMRELGTMWVYGHVPRVRIEADFVSPVVFGDEVTTTLTVAKVGRSSITFEAELSGPSGPVARCRVVTVYVDSVDGQATPVPDELRSRLSGEPVPS